MNRRRISTINYTHESIMLLHSPYDDDVASLRRRFYLDAPLSSTPLFSSHTVTPSVRHSIHPCFSSCSHLFSRAYYRRCSTFSSLFSSHPFYSSLPLISLPSSCLYFAAPIRLSLVRTTVHSSASSSHALSLSFFQPSIALFSPHSRVRAY